jgi:hypothetical protein
MGEGIPAIPFQRYFSLLFSEPGIRIKQVAEISEFRHTILREALIARIKVNRR